ncbi:XRE family transcriptional regulator [Histophilus somni]|uniref:XRE family transcriptional regulator n=1 Tax=Histophilus somni TaxID=731 RepID=UPI00201ECD00|nr:S24 family peptidase [Histophilus somni]
MTTLAERLKNLLDEKGITQTKFAEMIGIAQPSMQKILSGETKKPRNLLEIANVLEVDPNWLQNGVGEPDLSEEQQKKISSSINLLPKQDSVILSAYHKVSAGDGFLNADFPDEIRSIEFSPEGFMAAFNRRTSANLQLVMIDGNSMFDPNYPDLSLQHGDLVCIDRSIVEMQEDGIYAFSFEGSDRIKRLQRLSGHRLKVISDNPKYEDEILEGERLNDIRIIGKLIKKMTMTMTNL